VKGLEGLELILVLVRVYKGTNVCKAGWELEPVMNGPQCSDVGDYDSIRVKVKVDG
jgi:hypothetical protein